MNSLVMTKLTYKQQYTSMNKAEVILLKVLQPTVQVLFFVLIITANRKVANIGELIITNSILSACMYSAVYAASSLSNERMLGTLKFTIVSDRTAFQTISLRSFSSIIDGLLTVFVPIIFATVFFNITFNWREIIITVCCLILGMIASLSLSLFIGSISLITTDLNLFINIFMFVMNLTSGAIFPISELPLGLNKLASWVPLNNTIALTKKLLAGAKFTASDCLTLFSREIIIAIVVLAITYFIYQYFEHKAMKDGSLDFY